MGVEELVAAPAIKGATEAGAKGAEAGIGAAGAGGIGSSLLAPELAGAGALDVLGGAGATTAGAEGLAGATAALAPSAASMLGGADLGTTGVSPTSLSALTDPAAASGGAGLPGSTATPALGATAPGGAAPTGLTGTGITPSALSLDPTAAATGGAGSPASGALNVAGGANAAAGGAAPAAGGSSGFSLESLVGSAGKSIASNPLGIALAAGGLGFNALQGQRVSEAQKKLQEEAAQLNDQGKQLSSYLTNGNLPPGLQASIDQATASAKAKVRSNFAAQGMSTDPSKNTALQQELAMIDQQAVITIAQIGQQLLGAGQTASGISSQLYTTLANLDQTQTQRIGSAVANMAAALSPTRGLTINTGKA